jgi:hypothetical protein
MTANRQERKRSSLRSAAEQNTLPSAQRPDPGAGGPSAHGGGFGPGRAGRAPGADPSRAGRGAGRGLPREAAPGAGALAPGRRCDLPGGGGTTRLVDSSTTRLELSLRPPKAEPVSQAPAATSGRYLLFPLDSIGFLIGALSAVHICTAAKHRPVASGECLYPPPRTRCREKPDPNATNTRLLHIPHLSNVKIKEDAWQNVGYSPSVLIGVRTCIRPIKRKRLCS